MTKEELNHAIDRTRQIIEFNGYQTYSDYSFLCGCSNENQEAIAKTLNYKDKDILTVAASGEQYFSAKFAGAKNVTLYDINNLAKLYVYLKIGAWKKLNYDDFINFLIPNINEDKYFSLNTLLKIADYLPDYVTNYWYNVLKQFNKSCLEKLILYPTDTNSSDYIINGEPYYTRENYEKLKKIIETEEYPLFIPSSISDITKKLGNQKFDIIDTSNIIECVLSDSWVFDCYNDDIIPNWIKLVENQLVTLLSKDGQIIVDYDPSTFSDELIKHKSFKSCKIKSKAKNKGKDLILVYKNNSN